MNVINLLFALSSNSNPSRLRCLTTCVMSSASTNQLVIDPFCHRQFVENPASRTYGGTVFDITMEEFTKIVNERYSQDRLKDGYAPFCKHLFVPNDFTNAKVNVLKITDDNHHLLRTQYEARNDKELPVLVRFFPKELVVSIDRPLPTAKFLDLILYSREQINKENEAQGQEANPETAPWGIVSIKAQDVDFELPMTPITCMRNALGKEEGGSGIPLDRKAYMESVDYWKDHANIS
jgi:hypothetical protein